MNSKLHTLHLTIRTAATAQLPTFPSSRVARRELVYIGIYGGWNGVCGTSVASPFTGGVIGLAGNASSWDADSGEPFWNLTRIQHKRYFHHPSGGDGNCGNYLCGEGRYKRYYSGPGGWGTPNGLRAY